MKKYTAESKDAIIKRLMPPNPVSVATLSSETGIPLATLYNWRKQTQASGQAVPATTKHSEHWTAVDKLAIVFETRALNIAEIGEYCRKKGLYPEQIKAWEAAALSGYHLQEQLEKQRLQQSKEDRQRIGQLETELSRKNAALAETAALLVLSKKSRAIWGESEEC
jgi:transposase-like protein